MGEGLPFTSHVTSILAIIMGTWLEGLVTQVDSMRELPISHDVGIASLKRPVRTSLIEEQLFCMFSNIYHCPSEDVGEMATKYVASLSY